MPAWPPSRLRRTMPRVDCAELDEQTDLRSEADRNGEDERKVGPQLIDGVPETLGKTDETHVQSHQPGRAGGARDQGAHPPGERPLRHLDSAHLKSLGELSPTAGSSSSTQLELANSAAGEAPNESLPSRSWHASPPSQVGRDRFSP